MSSDTQETLSLSYSSDDTFNLDDYEITWGDCKYCKMYRCSEETEERAGITCGKCAYRLGWWDSPLQEIQEECEECKERPIIEDMCEECWLKSKYYIP